MEPGFYEETFLQETRSWWHRGRRDVLAALITKVIAESGLRHEAAMSGTRESARASHRDGGFSLVDVGCGTGGTTRFLADAVEATRVVACDTSPDALRLAARRDFDELVEADASALPFEDAAFDVVLSLDVLEHHEDDARVARELHRVLRPGGLLLATVPAFEALWGPHDVLSHHHRRYRRGPFLDLLRRAGFEVVRSSHFNTAIFPAVLALQTARRVARRGAPAQPASDLPRHMPAVVNEALARLFGAERHLVSRWSLPFGVSLVAVARRAPEAA